MTKELTQDEQKAAKLFRPLFRYVLARKLPIEEKKTASGIIVDLPTENKNTLAHANRAVIVAMGSKAFEFETPDFRPQIGEIINFNRYEDFNVEHHMVLLEGKYCFIYDEFVTAIENRV